MPQPRIITKSETFRSSPDISGLKVVKYLIPVRQETQIQSSPSILPPPAVVYLTRQILNSRNSRKIHEILIRSGMPVELRDVSMNSKFLSNLQNQVRHVTLPTVFIGGRYIGGENEVRLLKETGQLKSLVFSLEDVEYGVCRACGGYKFVLNGKDLNTCTACNGTSLKSDLSSSLSTSSGRSKLYICLDGEDCQRRHIYMIYSVEESWLATQQTNPPTIKTEAVIYGYPSMGCGVYDSKIILAGGRRPLDHDRHNGCITFDMTDNSVSHKPFMPMDEGKFKPLVFQLNKRLYVFDRQCNFNSRYDGGFLSIEFYSPAMKTRWQNVSNFFERPRRLDGSFANYACLVFGNSCLMSVPYDDATYKTHCNYLECGWVKQWDASLPFTGVATFYSQDDFEDFVMIYFSKGVVRVCKFDFSCFGDSQNLFTVKSGGEDMHGYFADFGKGCFCLTAFDKSYVYVYTFVVTREGTPSGPLKVTRRIESQYSFHFDEFSTEGRKITNVGGCFAPALNEEAKLRAEKAAATHYKNYLKINDDYDICDLDNTESLVLED